VLAQPSRLGADPRHERQSEHGEQRHRPSLPRPHLVFPLLSSLRSPEP